MPFTPLEQATEDLDDLLNYLHISLEYQHDSVWGLWGEVEYNKDNPEKTKVLLIQEFEDKDRYMKCNYQKLMKYLNSLHESQVNLDPESEEHIWRLLQAKYDELEGEEVEL